MPYFKSAKNLGTILIAITMILLLSCARSETKKEPFEYPSRYPSETKSEDLLIETILEAEVKKELDKPPETPIGGEIERKAVMPPVIETSRERTVGAILPLSGPYQEYGENVLQSLILAGNFFELGNDDQSVTLLLEDSASNTEKARHALSKLAVRSDLAAVIGPLSSQESFAAAQEAQKQGVPLLTLTRNEAITSVGDYIFNVLPSSRTQLNHLARYALANSGFKRIAVLYPDVPAGRDAAEVFQDELKKEGGRVTHCVSYKDDDTDFSSEIGALLGERLDTENKDNDARKIAHRINFDALFIPDSAQRVAQILLQLSFYNVRGFQLLGQSGMNAPDILMAHRELFEGAIFVDGYFPDGTMPQSSKFADRFYETYEQEADALDAYAYDALKILLNLLRKHSGMTRAQLRDEMAELNGEGVRGKIKTNSLRIMDSKPILVTIRDGYPVRIMTY